MFHQSTQKNLYSTPKVSIIFLISAFIMMSTMIISGKMALSTKAVNEGAKLPSSSVTANTNETWKLSYFHHDHLGNITAVTDEHGNLLELKDYLPFGGTNVHEIYGDYQSNYAYNDKEKDDESNLYYYGARYYNDSTSKFTSIDPALFNEKYLNSILDDPQKLNSYSYARNNPINYVDTNGEEPNKAQATTIDKIIDRVRKIENGLGDKSDNYEYVLASIFNEFETLEDNENNPRYVYTEKEGWIDFKHFFGSAFYSLDSGSFMALLFGYVVELRQTKNGDDSAFSYEDLPSNYEGVTFGQVLQYFEDNDLENIKVSDALKYFFENLDPTNPEDAPNYDELDESAAEGNGKDGSNVGSNDESTNKNDKENGHD